jgi:hypothetical protein
MAVFDINLTARHSVLFMNDNVFHSFTRWKRVEDDVRYRLLKKCLSIYTMVFEVECLDWKEAKRECARSLLAANSSLMVVLSTGIVILL